MRNLSEIQKDKSLRTIEKSALKQIKGGKSDSKDGDTGSPDVLDI